MPPTRITNTLYSWAGDAEPRTIEQARATARLPIIAGHVALMPDAHVGMGATVGSVIPTRDAVIPAAVGVDIGCGMVAAELDVTAEHLPDSLDPLLDRIATRVPAGVGRGHDNAAHQADRWMRKHTPHTRLSQGQTKRALTQFGTLGSGNHFVEVCLDERDHVWVVLHSGSRGIGNQLAQAHIETAKRLRHQLPHHLEDPNLAWLVQGTEEFDAYIGDMLWAQDYAAANREQMVTVVLREVLTAIGFGREVGRVNCHHNFTQREVHGGQELWITRKGAIKADVGDLGVIPGSMGTRSYVVAGLGSTQSYTSCSHGAGRRFSRTAARQRFSAADLAEAMGDRTWLKGKAGRLVDEIPGAYKDIDQVMADQADLVEVRHTLRQVLNYKGT
jgi:tRNA-splicing ligase RtcB (3'-phosphate/5'-hydroxy nucleic acid ligase)